jgi:predicted amidophosphoribosyltransferase
MLAHRRLVADQAGLSASARAANLEGAFAASGASVRGGGVEARRVVVVDDVVTTGSSLAAAVSALRAAGHVPCAAVSLAATVRRRPSSTGIHMAAEVSTR